jgi:carboxyl-terminal processing protease
LFKRRSVRSALLVLTLFACVQPEARAQKLQCAQLPELFTTFLRHHYAHHDLTDAIRAQTVEQFIESLDPSRTTLLQPDVDKIRKDLLPMFRTMYSGNCKVLDEIYELMVTRAKENEDWVKEITGPKFKLDETVELMMDPKKRGYSKTAEDRKKLTSAMVHFQVSSALLADPSVEKARGQIFHRYEIITRRARERNPAELVTIFAESFARALDPHTTYLSRDAMEDFQINMQLSLEGIGVSLTSQDGYVVVEDIIPGGSADRAKMLQPKDKIIAVTQADKRDSSPVSTIDMDLRDVVKMIRGKKGTKVKLTVLRQGEKTETFDVTLARDKIDIQEQAAKLSFQEKTVNGRKLKIGVLDLPSFYGGREAGSRSSYRDVRDLLIKARKEKADGIVLDLSRNGGGLLDDAVRISGLFIKKGPVVATQDTRRTKDVLSDDDEEVVWSGPLMVLTSRLSASASEILAGALKDYRRALIVGADHTFGKGSVQVLSPLAMDLGAMKVTTGMYFLPKGASTQHQGVASDIVLPSLFSSDEIGEKTLEYSLPPASIPSFAGKEVNTAEGKDHWDEVDPAVIPKLAEASKKRVAEDAKFVEIRKDIADAEKNRGPVKLAEVRKKSEGEKKKEDKEKKTSRRKRGDTDTPQLEEAVRIMTDWLTSRPALANHAS